MCTVSWLPTGDGYELFFNRDERYQRPAIGPAIGGRRGVAWIRPRDAEADGSWISANQLGVTVGMTNFYPEAPPPRPRDPVSRGLLLASISDADSLAEVTTRIRNGALERYEPFSIVAAAPATATRVLTWDGVRLRERDHAAPGFVLASSGAEPPGLQAIRRTVFQQAIAREGLNRETLLAVHASHIPERGALSVCVHRGIAGTVSSSHVIVDRDTVEFRYAPGPPCVTEFGAPIRLQRSAPCPS